jgi:hypothetical protein
MRRRWASGRSPEADINQSQLPYRENAEVTLSKVRDYLLSDAHPIGWTKARCFRSLGFHKDAPGVLQAALLEVARLGVVVAKEQSRFGSKICRR